MMRRGKTAAVAALLLAAALLTTFAPRSGAGDEAASAPGDQPLRALLGQ